NFAEESNGFLERFIQGISASLEGMDGIKGVSRMGNGVKLRVGGCLSQGAGAFERNGRIFFPLQDQNWLLVVGQALQQIKLCPMLLDVLLHCRIDRYVSTVSCVGSPSRSLFLVFLLPLIGGKVSLGDAVPQST